MIDSLLAIPAFLPLTVCTGYLAAWFTDLHDFRKRSIVERIFWSIPLSIAVSTISLVLIGRFLSLTTASVFLLLCSVLWLAILGREWFGLRRSGAKWNLGLQPLGGTMLLLAVVWIAVVVLSLVDFQKGQQLFMSLFISDHSARVNWIQSTLRTGIPPTNPFYFYKDAAQMRNYYFWYVDCASVAEISRLPARAILTSSCVWSGFALVALIGLYLKHFLCVGTRLRKQFLLAVSLLAVTGLDICVNIVDLFIIHRPPYLDFEWWSRDPIYSWYASVLWVPHHVAGLVCCMFAFLLAWMAGKDSQPNRLASLLFIAFALASAFGLSIFVPFGFFLVMLAWGFWQVTVERTARPALLLAGGGILAAVLLIPYLWELTHDGSKMQGGSIFGISVRETFPPTGLLASPLLQHLSSVHPSAARNIANLILLVPGYAVELGFYTIVLLLYAIPTRRGLARNTPEQRSLVFIAVAIIPIISFIRSAVLRSNDFGWRAALILQFPLLLLASELIMGWRLQDRSGVASSSHQPSQLLRSTANLALGIGVISTFFQMLPLRFDAQILEGGFRAKGKPQPGIFSHNAYMSYFGYRQLATAIPVNSIVQFNPGNPWAVWKMVDVLDVDHQVSITSDEPGCGSELGGDPSGCPAMAAAVDALYKGATAEEARATCHRYGTQYLIAKIYDPAWNDQRSWVWTLKPVVSDPEFRALDCRE
ncbi:MAG: hypothetical protein WB608_20175 [Terracidiphilus sp.]